jgi:hypothetical protein
MRSPFAKLLPSQRGSAPAKPASDTPTSQAVAPPADFGWHESSYELMRGVDVIECEWPDTSTGHLND